MLEKPGTAEVGPGLTVLGARSCPQNREGLSRPTFTPATLCTWLGVLPPSWHVLDQTQVLSYAFPSDCF